MDKKNQTPTVVEASVTTEVETVEKQDKTEVEVETKVVEAVEASNAEVTDVTEDKQTVEATDTRIEFKSFVAAFGAEQAAEYFAQGLSLADATAKFVIKLREENDSLKERLAAANQGESKPINFRDTHSEPKPQGSFIRLRK